jgi:hypothetical protein
MGLLCGRAGRLTTEYGGFRPGQFEIQWPKVSVKYFEFFKLFNFDITALMRTWGCANPIFATFYVKVPAHSLCLRASLFLFTRRVVWRAVWRGCDNKVLSARSSSS